MIVGGIAVLSFIPSVRQVTFVEFLPGGRELLVAAAAARGAGAWPGSLEIWDVSKGKRVRKIELGTDTDASTVSLSDDGKTVAVGGRDGTPVKVFNLASGLRVRTLDTTMSSFPQSAFLPGGKKLAVVNSAQFTEYGHLQAEIVDLSTGNPTKLISSDGANSVAIDPKGRWLAIATQLQYGSPNQMTRHFHSRVHIYDLQSMQLVQAIHYPDDKAMASLRFTSTGSMLAVRRADGFIEMRRLADGSLAQVLTSSPTPMGLWDGANKMITSKYDSLLAVLTGGTGVTVFDLHGGKSKTYFSRGWIFWRCMAISPDTHQFVVGTSEGKVEFRDIETGKLTKSLNCSTPS